jgi:ubiquinone biosynthesis protein
VIKPRNLQRLLHIQRVLLRNGLDDMVRAMPLPGPLRFAATAAPIRRLRSPEEPRGVRIRCALEELGPIFVKFGQTLSTRRDLLPDDIAEELVKLQDRVPPFPGEQARLRIEQALGKPVTDLFQAFEETPLASASVAQVHAARLPSGESVVVKVLRSKSSRNSRKPSWMNLTWSGRPPMRQRSGDGSRAPRYSTFRRSISI